MKHMIMLKNMKLIWIVIPLVLFSVIGISDSFGQTEQWSVQFGGSSSDGSHGIVVDSLGNVYVTGTTEGDLFDTPAGESDAFIAKYDTNGNPVWAKQFGSDLSDGGNSVAVDSSGNVYVTGNTSGSLFGIISGKSDAFIAKYDTNGNPVWAKQFGSDLRDIGFGIAVDSSDNVYITGHTNGDLFDRNTGAYDAFIAKYDTNGNPVWAKQFGTNSLEEHSGIAVDSSDNVYITGSSTGDNRSGTNIGSNDVFITKYAKNGIKMWAKQFGSISFEGSYDVAVDLSNNVYVTGTAIGDLSGTNMGKMDAFVVKYDSQIFTLQSSLKHQIKNTIPVNDITCKNKTIF